MRHALALALALLAGFIDATGFVASGKYFVSFMSGNTTRFSVDLVTDSTHALVPVLLIVGFVVGVSAGALVVRAAGRWRKTAVIGLTAILITLSAIGRTIGNEALFLGCSAIAMGAINNTFGREAHIAIGLTYMTGALVRFGQGLAARLCGETREGWLFNLALWLSLSAGAVAGTYAQTHDAPIAPWISVALAALLVAAAGLIERGRLAFRPS